MLRYLSSGSVIGVLFDSCMGSLLLANSLFFSMCILYYDSGILSMVFGGFYIPRSGAYVQYALYTR